MPPTIALALLLGAQAELNLPKPDESIALVARRISTRAIPFTPGDFNLEFRAKYEVVKVVYGSYDRPAIEFKVYDHYGTPAFFAYDTVLLYVSRLGKEWIHEKYQFHEVFKAANGRWASCGDPYRYEYEKGKIAAVPLVFDPELSFSLAALSEEQIEQKFPRLYFERRKDAAVCRAGAYIEQLFEIKRDGVFNARGRFQ